jgi:RecJ-like exonuclease
METRFNIGQGLYYVGKKRLEIECDKCKGTGKLELVIGGDIGCPQCVGTGKQTLPDLVDGDVLSFIPNVIQIQIDSVFYAEVSQEGQTLHVVNENDIYETAEDAEYSKSVKVV